MGTRGAILGSNAKFLVFNIVSRRQYVEKCVEAEHYYTSIPSHSEGQPNLTIKLTNRHIRQ